MKKWLYVVIAGLMVSTASADMCKPFEDKIDYWSISCGQFHAEPDATGEDWWQGIYDAASITEETPLMYRHDISDDFNIPSEYLVTQATLELDFTNDPADGVYRVLPFIWWYDSEEYVTVGYQAASGTWETIGSLGEVDNGQYDLVLDIDWLNDDGKLDVKVSIADLGCTWESISLDHSRLYGCVEPVTVPVPGAALLGMLGLSAAGLRLRKWC